MASKKAIVLVLAMVVILGGIALTTEWNELGTSVNYDETVPEEGIPFHPENGELAENSLNYQLFENYGGLLLVLGILMFGAMVAGICISREEADSDD
ncbi:MAG: hypothetical protein IJF47_03825 [Candidatus Methanomethylophilaceae archaeon]|nr:hypothetical protein [Candidatus Methanomethylophilaceae archaeon]